MKAFSSSPKNRVAAPAFASLIKQPVMFLGFGFGSGLITPAPGTWGTLMGMVLFLPVILLSEWAGWGLLALTLVFGSWICGESARLIGVHDHGGIVWDEFAGIGLVLVALPQQTWPFWLLAFVAFRVFDILKPWPINWLDARVSGGFGIMVDDVLAGCYALAVIWLMQGWLSGWL